jgi:hypothetical protein
MKTEDLIQIGLDEEAAKKVFSLYGKSVEKLKADATTYQTEAESLKAQLADAGKQIESFKGLDIEGVKKAAEDWKAKAEQAQAEAAAKVESLKFDYALEKGLQAYKVKDPADVMPHLKRDMLKLDESGGIIGLKEQIEPLKEAKEYLFVNDNPPPRIVGGGQTKSVMSDAVLDAARKAAGLK